MRKKATTLKTILCSIKLKFSHFVYATYNTQGV